MATFSPAVQKRKQDGTYLVYIRVTHMSKPDYIKTDMYVTANKIDEKKKITDAGVLKKCDRIIEGYNEKLNRVDTRNWNVKDIVKFITTDGDSILFYDYCDKFILKLRKNNQEKSADNYKTAVNNFKKFFGDNITFADITKYKVKEWIKTLEHTKRAKESYPKHVKTIFDAGTEEYNEIVEQITNRPFDGVKIPAHDEPEFRAIPIENIRKIVNFKPYSKQTEMAVDVAKLMLYFVGMNTVDIFKMTKDNIKNGKLCYTRSKTRKRRGRKPYIEVAIRPEIEYLMTKYAKGDKLWDFGYCDSNSLSHYVNKGIKRICVLEGIDLVDPYGFRHSWATIARTVFGASDEFIGFCFTHQSAYKVTSGYIEIDYSPIDRMNNKIIDYIFFPKKHEQRMKKLKEQKVDLEWVS